MTIKRFIFRSYIRFFEKLCLAHPAKKCFNTNLSLQPLPDDNQSTDIVTVAYNNDKIIPLHLQYMQKYYSDAHTHIIADNSSDQSVSEKTQGISNYFFLTIS